MDTVSNFNSYILSRTGHSPLHIKARIIGFNSGKISQTGIRNTRWTEATAYQTEDKRFVLHVCRRSQAIEEKEQNWLVITMRPELLPEKVIKHFGHINHAVQHCLDSADIYRLSANTDQNLQREKSGDAITFFPLGKNNSARISVQGSGLNRKISIIGEEMTKTETELFTLAILEALEG